MSSKKKRAVLIKWETSPKLAHIPHEIVRDAVREHIIFRDNHPNAIFQYVSEFQYENDRVAILSLKPFRPVPMVVPYEEYANFFLTGQG